MTVQMRARQETRRRRLLAWQQTRVSLLMVVTAALFGSRPATALVQTKAQAAQRQLRSCGTATMGPPETRDVQLQLNTTMNVRDQYS
jgi:hypothetical protein